MDRRERVADTDDDWQRHVTHAAAKEIGTWLEARGRLHQPIRCLTMPELEAMASTAISRFVVLASQRIRDRPEETEAPCSSQGQALTRLLLG